MSFSRAAVLSAFALVALQAFAQNSAPPAVPESIATNLFVVSDEEALAKTRIRSETTRLLEAKDYRGLDAFAGQLQQNGRKFARGYWEISFFFSELTDLPPETTDDNWEAHMQLVRDWFEQDTDSIIARIAMAQALVEYGWKARTHGSAQNVTDDGWRLFGERTTEARRILIAAEVLPHKCPVFYETQLYVALVDGTSRTRYDEIFAEAINEFPDYARFYVIRANYLLPRWHGGLGDWENFATLTADRVGGEQGDILYTQIVWRMHEMRIYGNIMKDAAVDWARIQRGFEAICHKYPNSISAQSEYCSISGFAPKGARPLMRSLFQRLEKRVDLSVWLTTENYRRDYKWAFSEPVAGKTN